VRAGCVLPINNWKALGLGCVANSGSNTVSVYGYLNCHDCRQTMWLGKSCHDFYHIGAAEEPPLWKREILNQALWKFLAEHTGHQIDVRLEHEVTEDMFGYKRIGGETDYDLPFDKYLAGWRGLAPR
jgi:hypothetical protein